MSETGQSTEDEHRSCGSLGVVGRRGVGDVLSEEGEDVPKLPTMVAHIYENTKNHGLYTPRGWIAGHVN